MNYKGKTCIVTGAAGAIGSRLCKRLIELGATVVGYDDLSSGHEWLLPAGMDESSQFGETGDLMYINREPRPDGCVVFHLAAHFANQNSVDHPETDLMVNGLGTLRLLEWSAGSAERFVFASAGCAAGQKNTPYQIHKTLGEHYCTYFADRVPTVVCRFHNSYGPGEVPGKYRNVIPNWMWAAMNNRPLTVYGDGMDARDFVYVDDLVDAMIGFEPAKGADTVCEIGTGSLTQTAILAREILKLTKSSSRLVFEPKRKWDHPGRRAKTTLPTYRTPLRVGLSKVHDWMREHQEELKKVET